MKKLFIIGSLILLSLTGCSIRKEQSSIVTSLQQDVIITTAPAQEEIEETTEAVTEITTTTAAQDYYVYKPSTHYIHRASCHWVDDTCYKITVALNIDARICTECNPNVEIYHPYIEFNNSVLIDDYSRQLLAEITYHEAGSDWISIYNKARIVSGVMNRVCDTRFPCTVYEVLTQEGQFEGYWPGCCVPTKDCYAAVDYYFTHINEFDSCNSWYGDGYQNYFYYQ